LVHKDCRSLLRLRVYYPRFIAWDCRIGSLQRAGFPRAFTVRQIVKVDTLAKPERSLNGFFSHRNVLDGDTCGGLTSWSLAPVAVKLERCVYGSAWAPVHRVSVVLPPTRVFRR
jgi:hypothetical protein